MAAPPTESVPQQVIIAFHFEPTPRDVVSFYLPQLIAGKPTHAFLRPFIHAADIYACAPGELAAQFRSLPSKADRFFFTSVERQKHTPGEGARYVRVRNRVAGPGSWSFRSREDVKDGDNGKVGEIRRFRYTYRNGVETEWLMDEYSCACSVKRAVVGDRERVFCRIYASSPNDAGQNSAAATAKKRPAPAIADKPPCAKRIRAARVAAGSGCTTSFPSPRPCTPRHGTVPSSSSATRPAPPRPSALTTSQAAPLTPRPATSAARFLPVPFPSPDDHLQPTEQPAEAEDGLNDHLFKEIDKIPTTCEAEEEETATSPDGPPCLLRLNMTSTRLHQLTTEADDDTE